MVSDFQQNIITCLGLVFIDTCTPAHNIYAFIHIYAHMYIRTDALKFALRCHYASHSSNFCMHPCQVLSMVVSVALDMFPLPHDL